LQRSLYARQCVDAGGGEIRLEQCLEEFSREAVLDDANKWKCENCGEFVCARKTVKIWTIPQILVIHLKRFERTHNGRLRKLETNVSFPDEIDLGNVAQGSTGICRYSLFAVDEHVGSLNSGHYIARAYCSSRQCWYRFSDSAIEPCSVPAVHTPNAYVLFYERTTGVRRKSSRIEIKSQASRDRILLPV
jgi:ubiquitin C-terminal hydrolase